MKKRILTCLLALLAVLTMAVPAWAEPASLRRSCSLINSVVMVIVSIVFSLFGMILLEYQELFAPSGTRYFCHIGKNTQKRHLKPQVSKPPARYISCKFDTFSCAFTDNV